MLSVQKGTVNIRLDKPELDHFIDAAMLLLLFGLFTFNIAAKGMGWVYYTGYALFAGLSAVKVIVRLRYDGKLMIPGIALWYLAFSLYGLSTLMWTEYPAVVLSTVVRKVQIIALFFFVSQTYATQKGVERLLKLYIWAATGCVCYVLLSAGSSQWLRQIFGSGITGANFYGYVLSLTSMISVYFAYYKGKRIYYLFALAQILATFLTASRKSILMLCVGLLILAFLKDKSIKLLFRVLVVVLVAMFAFYLIMNVDRLYWLIGRRFEEMLEHLMGTDRDNSMYKRALFIDYAKRFFQQHPLIGNGDYSFTSMMGEAGGIRTYAHNNFYEVLTDFGLIGTILYYGMYAYILVKLIKPALVYESDGAKLFLALMVVMILSEYGVVVYYTVNAMLFIAAAFMFVSAYDAQAKRAFMNNGNNLNGNGKDVIGYGYEH